MCSERRENEASGRFASHGRLEGIDLRRVECELEGEARDAICKACVRAGRTTVCAERRGERDGVEAARGGRRRAGGGGYGEAARLQRKCSTFMVLVERRVCPEGCRLRESGSSSSNSSRCGWQTAVQWWWCEETVLRQSAVRLPTGRGGEQGLGLEVAATLGARLIGFGCKNLRRAGRLPLGGMDGCSFKGLAGMASNKSGLRLFVRDMHVDDSDYSTMTAYHVWTWETVVLQLLRYRCLYINSSTLPQLTCLLHEAKKGESTYIPISWAECHVEENGAMCSPCSSSGVLIRGALSLSPRNMSSL